MTHMCQGLTHMTHIGTYNMSKCLSSDDGKELKFLLFLFEPYMAKNKFELLEFPLEVKKIFCPCWSFLGSQLSSGLNKR